MSYRKGDIPFKRRNHVLFLWKLLNDYSQKFKLKQTKIFVCKLKVNDRGIFWQCRGTVVEKVKLGLFGMGPIFRDTGTIIKILFYQ